MACCACIAVILYSVSGHHCHLVIINWIIDFLTSRYQRVFIDGIKTDYLPINRGVPQGKVLGPMLFSIMINDIRPVQAFNLIVKFADDINLGIMVTDDSDTSHMEANNIKIWRTQIV